MTDDGRVLEKSYPAAQAPDLGQVVEIDGVRATRILSAPAAVRADNWKPYVSTRLPRNLEGVRCTPSGKPIVETRAQERNICSRFGYERE